MPSAPLVTVDGSGVLHWTNPATPPSEWILEVTFADGSPASYVDLSNNVGGTNTSFDAHGAGWPGGYCVKMSGVDGDGNLIIAPTTSVQTLLNQP